MTLRPTLGRATCCARFFTPRTRPAQHLGTASETRGPLRQPPNRARSTTATPPPHENGGAALAPTTNVAKQAALITARSPHIPISAGHQEFLAQSNLDDSTTRGSSRPAATRARPEDPTRPACEGRPDDIQRLSAWAAGGPNPRALRLRHSIAPSEWGQCPEYQIHWRRVLDTQQAVAISLPPLVLGAGGPQWGM